MSKYRSPLGRREFLLTSATAGVVGALLPLSSAYAETAPMPVAGAGTPVAANASTTLLQASGLSGAALTGTVAAATSEDDESIRPFRFRASEDALADLRRRVSATKLPDRETVTDASQGVQLATIQKLARYWATEHNWRKVEERLNALPQFVTRIDGVDIHFIHVRSKQPKALPVIITHGWPGSIIEQMKVIEPLTNPTAHGGTAADAFDVVIPSLPGHGFSGKPTVGGWDPIRIARAWAVLMQRLGYKRYVAQGGDWGNAVTEQMALLTPPGLIGIHTNMPATIPDDIAAALQSGNRPSILSDEERYA